MTIYSGEQTTAVSPQDLIKVVIIQRKEDFIEALESYNLYISKGADPNTHVIKARLISLFLCVQPAMKRTYTDYDHVHKVINWDLRNITEIQDCFNHINTWLDFIEITRIDNKKRYNSLNAEDENKAKGI